MEWGITELSDDFKRASAAARELGKEEVFLSTNKYLSKLAHPTAWVVNSVSSEEADAEGRDQIFKEGVLTARQSLLKIRDLLLANSRSQGMKMNSIFKRPENTSPPSAF